MLGEERLLACREGEPVVYIRQPTHFAEKYIIYKINTLISLSGATPSDFFILGASIKGNNSEIRKIENALVENNIPCYVPLSEDDKIDDRVIEGKVVFSTFHSVKGRQRKYVFVIGFNQSYFNLFAKKKSTDVCPNTFYVACTRATEGLYIVEHNNRRYDRPPKFLKMGHFGLKNEPYVVFKGMHQTIFEERNEDLSNNTEIVIKKTSPTELVRFLPENIFDKINDILEKIFIPLHSEPFNEIKIPNIIKTESGFYEDVSNINGIALPIMYFDNFPSEFNEETNTESTREFSNFPTNSFGRSDEKINLLDRNVERSNEFFYFDSKRSDIGDNLAILQSLIESEMSCIKNNHHSFLRKEIENCFTPSFVFKNNENDIDNCNNFPTNSFGRFPENSVSSERSVDEKMNKISKYLKVSNLYYSVKEKLYFKMKQIKHNEYNWFSKELVEECFERMDKVLLDEVYDKKKGIFKGKVEETFILSNDDTKHCKIDQFLKEHLPNFIFRFNARVDLITDNSIWEIKCVNSITHEHLLQLAIYCWLWRMTMEDMENLVNVLNFQIFNVKTGEHYILNSSTEQLNEIILTLLAGKYTDLSHETDEDFIENCRKHICIQRFSSGTNDEVKNTVQ
jgi:hypothetical protein